MKHFTLLVMLSGFLIFSLIPQTFGGTNAGSDFGFFTNDGKDIANILEVGKEVRVQQKVFNESTDLSTMGTMKFFITDDSKSLVETITIHEFSILPNEDELFNSSYIPKETGDFILHVETEYSIPHDAGRTSSVTFSIVDEYSKAFTKNYDCDEGFRRIMKADFSTVVCVTEDTHKKLLQRGWHT